MSKPTQIGWYTLKADKVFRNTYECAAWYEDVLVKAGKYPVLVYDFRVLEHQDPKFDRKIEGHIDGTYTHMDGTVVSDEFGARFFGVPVGDYDNSKNAGKPSSHSMMVYMYEVADSVLNDPESPWELLPEYEARPIHGELDGEPYISHAIYRVRNDGTMKYFSTQRPVAPGSFPKPDGNKVIDLWNFNGPVFCEEIGREAWGYVIYEKALTEEEAASYELIPAGTKLFWCVTSSYDGDGRVTAAITATKEATSKPQNTCTSTRRKDIYHDWFDSQEEAKKFVEEAKKA